MYKRVILAMACLFAGTQFLNGQRQVLSLNEAILLARKNSVDAAVALNELRTAYWEYRTFRAEQLPELSFTTTVPSYRKDYVSYQLEDGSYKFIRNNRLSISGQLDVSQNVPLTGGVISMSSSVQFNHQPDNGFQNEYMSIPVSVNLSQPLFGINTFKWNRKIEPVRYAEAKAGFMEKTEEVTITTIAGYFNVLLAREQLESARQNLENADRLFLFAQARHQIGQLSDNDLMQLELTALQAKATLTEAESNLNARIFRLCTFLGLSEDVGFEVEIPEDIRFDNIGYADVMDRALTNNAHAKNILRRQLEADYEVARAKANQRDINLYASIGYTGVGGQMKAAYRQLADNQIVEVGVAIPLMDWGKRKGKVKVAESNRQVVEAQLRQKEQEFRQEIFLLVENFNNQAGQLRIAREADKIARRRYQSALETFIIGKISILDLNDARESKDDARQKLIQDLYLCWNYYYNIRSLTLYDYMNEQPIDWELEKIIFSD